MQIKKCRLCNNSDLKLVLNLKPTPVADDFVGENPRKSRVGRRVDQFGLANRHQQAFGCSCVGSPVFLAQVEVFLKRILFLTGCFESLLEMAENAH